MKYPKLRDGLRSARKSNGLSQKAVADELGLPRTAITQIENGNRKLSTLELTKLANLYRCSVQELLDDIYPTQTEDAIDALQRVAPELHEDCDVRDQVASYVKLCRDGNYLKHLIGVGSISGPPDYCLSRPSSFSEAILQGENVADQERQRIGIINSPLVDIAGLISRLGIWVSSIELPNTVSGLFIRDRDVGRAILVNSRYARDRMDFSLAHEYAHAIFDRESVINVSSTHNSGELTECRANAFATSFLMPKHGVFDELLRLGTAIPTRQVQSVYDVAAGRLVDNRVRRTVGSQRVGYKDVAELAHHYQVSYQVALSRLKHLQHVSAADTQKLLSQQRFAHEYRSELGILEESEGKEHCALTLRREIMPLAIEAYRREEISRGRVLEIASSLGISGEALLRLAHAARNA